MRLKYALREFEQMMNDLRSNPPRKEATMLEIQRRLRIVTSKEAHVHYCDAHLPHPYVVREIYASLGWKDPPKEIK